MDFGAGFIIGSMMGSSYSSDHRVEWRTCDRYSGGFGMLALQQHFDNYYKPKDNPLLSLLSTMDKMENKPEPTVIYAKTERDKLESKIMDLILEFETSTNTMVTNVVPVFAAGITRNLLIKIEVTVEVLR